MWERIAEELPRFFTYYNVIFFLKAMFTTFLLSLVGCLLGSVMGGVLAVIKITKSNLLRPLRIAAVVYVEFFRRIPFLVTLLLIFFVFQALGLEVSVFTVAVVSVWIIATAFIAEIVRSGLEAVPKTQWEAAEVLNFNLRQTLKMVILPQAWKVILPPAFSFFVLFIKDTALASQIGVVELTYSAKVLNNKGFSAALAFGFVLLLYYTISYPLTKFGTWMEKKIEIS
ncbi:MAG: amino acid ABC transporter permease [Desulfobacteraceae bacterium]|nr:amino acid ABC transporter permease [Desulfobacteraceae bacterium]MBC2752636.1 amino acid ABC transporter permease [Desulfobacteraceae bacterium]